MKWQPMSTAPHSGEYIAAKMKRGDLMIVSWQSELDGESGWWLEEGALIADKDMAGWSPIPQAD